MERNFFHSIRKISNELGGDIFDNSTYKWFDLGFCFKYDGSLFVDHLNLKFRVSDFTTSIKSTITGDKYVSLNTYTYLLVEHIEFKFGITVKLTPFLSRFYFTGEMSFN